MMYYLDPTEDCTPEEIHAILALPQWDFWRADEIPEGCERHFVAISEERIAELKSGKNTTEAHGPGKQ